MGKAPRDIIILEMCTINGNHMMYDSWDLEHATDKIFCHLGPFYALLPSFDPDNENFEKMKKYAGDIISLHMCTIDNNHMTYDSWNIDLYREWKY